MKNRHSLTRFGAAIVVTVFGSLLVMASPAGAVTQTFASGEPGPPNGAPDPNTTISPGGSGGLAIITLSQPIPGKPALPGGRWISRVANAASSPPTTQYFYTRRFSLPSCIQNARISVRMMADDLGAVSLNGTPFGSGASFGSPSTFTSTGLVPGVNVLVFTVNDSGFVVTGLDYVATVDYNTCEQGIVKVCKIAGPGVALNQPFTFTAAGQSISVPAGPASQGGFCKPFPTGFPLGNLTIQETLPPLYQVVAPIGVAPTGRLVSSNPATGSVTVNVGSGVTEVTFTDRGPGFIEVCKETVPAATPQMFTFNVQGPVGPAQTVTIPGGGTCSGPLQVASGTVAVTENVPAGWVMTNQCHTLPLATLLLSCNPVTHVATATVAGGDISTQTLLYFRNTCQSPAVCGIPIDGGGGGTNPGTPVGTAANLCDALAQQLAAATTESARQVIRSAQETAGCLP